MDQVVTFLIKFPILPALVNYAVEFAVGCRAKLSEDQKHTSLEWLSINIAQRLSGLSAVVLLTFIVVNFLKFDGSQSPLNSQTTVTEQFVYELILVALFTFIRLQSLRLPIAASIWIIAVMFWAYPHLFPSPVYGCLSTPFGPWCMSAPEPSGLTIHVYMSSKDETSQERTLEEHIANKIRNQRDEVGVVVSVHRQTIDDQSAESEVSSHQRSLVLRVIVEREDSIYRVGIEPFGLPVLVDVGIKNMLSKSSFLSRPITCSVDKAERCTDLAALRALLYTGLWRYHLADVQSGTYREAYDVWDRIRRRIDEFPESTDDIGHLLADYFGARSLFGKGDDPDLVTQSVQQYDRLLERLGTIAPDALVQERPYQLRNNCQDLNLIREVFVERATIYFFKMQDSASARADLDAYLDVCPDGWREEVRFPSRVFAESLSGKPVPYYVWQMVLDLYPSRSDTPKIERYLGNIRATCTRPQYARDEPSCSVAPLQYEGYLAYLRGDWQHAEIVFGNAQRNGSSHVDMSSLAKLKSISRLESAYYQAMIGQIGGLPGDVLQPIAAEADLQSQDAKYADLALLAGDAYSLLGQDEQARLLYARGFILQRRYPVPKEEFPVLRVLLPRSFHPLTATLPVQVIGIDPNGSPVDLDDANVSLVPLTVARSDSGWWDLDKGKVSIDVSHIRGIYQLKDKLAADYFLVVKAFGNKEIRRLVTFVFPVPRVKVDIDILPETPLQAGDSLMAAVKLSFDLDGNDNVARWLDLSDTDALSVNIEIEDPVSSKSTFVLAYDPDTQQFRTVKNKTYKLPASKDKSRPIKVGATLLVHGKPVAKTVVGEFD